MRYLIQSVFALAILAISFAPNAAQAQVERGDKTAYIRPHVGLSYYMGDNEKSPFTFDGEIFESLPYNVGAEIGWKFSPSYSVGLDFSYGDFNQITDFEFNTDPSSHPTTRWAVSLLARKLMSDRKMAPYWFGGFTVAGGESTVFNAACAANVAGTCTTDTGIVGGVTAGFGLDWALSERTSFFVQTGLSAVMPDDVIDGRDNNGFTGLDFLGSNTLGLNVNLSRFVPVEVESVMCPADVVDTGVPTTFTGMVNEKASQPVDYMWNFGDGSSAEGLTATHTFNRAGVFTVGLTATNGNGKGRSLKECTVTVKDPCVAAQITAMRASNMSPDTETEIHFTASTAGSEATSYRWDFGDGNTGTGAMAMHTYEHAGTYTVTLEVTNCAGTVSRTMTITVNPYEAAICREVTEMNAAFFAQNSSVLTDEARAALQDNLAILLECPNLNVRLEGWAAPGERRAQQLSEDRARAVEQFYGDNGVAASRMVTQGMGRAQGTSKKEGASQYRRVDTIPVR